MFRLRLTRLLILWLFSKPSKFLDMMSKLIACAGWLMWT